GSQTPRHRADLHRRIPPGDQVRIQARHRRQAAGDRPCRQPRLPVSQPHHRAVAALVSQELEHIGGGRRRPGPLPPPAGTPPVKQPPPPPGPPSPAQPPTPTTETHWGGHTLP